MQKVSTFSSNYLFETLVWKSMSLSSVYYIINIFHEYLIEKYEISSGIKEKNLDLDIMTTDHTVKESNS